MVILPSNDAVASIRQAGMAVDRVVSSSSISLAKVACWAARWMYRAQVMAAVWQRISSAAVAVVVSNTLR